MQQSLTFIYTGQLQLTSAVLSERYSELTHAAEVLEMPSMQAYIFSRVDVHIMTPSSWSIFLVSPCRLICSLCWVACLLHQAEDVVHSVRG